MTTVETGRTAAAVWSALGTVRDPELDEPLTELGFVSRAEVSEAGRAVVRLRLPTYFCAPNFAFLMVADSYDAVSAVPGVAETDVELEDHFAADAINRGVAARAGFVASFEGEAVGELDQLRADFVRKAVLAGTDRVCRRLLASGFARDRLASLALGDVPPGGDVDRLRERRREIGLPAGDSDPLLVDAVTGAPVGSGGLDRHLRFARLTRTSQEANSGVCRGMLHARYPHIGEQEGTG
ncbi:metal-sulfur cluster assembly factor [Amycolatopsis sp.]|uniref:metal-sulfur cluster assembly factor n=1 Tax=Amycolatopsis sp. TaxID=37632 RepID=UPI002B9EC589|nr:iron-sulfur cluster assembly protein [Amycolatopsis sp.]HVV07868.1 iron-sulfur cluster assembly protein [Amycolatopsis sp.]